MNPEISIRSLDSSVGVLHLAATSHGLVRICFPNVTRHDVQTDLLRDFPTADFVEDNRLDYVAEQIDDFLIGQRRSFDVELDLRSTHGFRRDVLEQLVRIPYGKTQSYGSVAASAGNPGAARAVGTACARNPLVLVVPCHRVVRSDGSIGEYGGGTKTKELLLSLEAS